MTSIGIRDNERGIEQVEAGGNPGRGRFFDALLARSTLPRGKNSHKGRLREPSTINGMVPRTWTESRLHS